MNKKYVSLGLTLVLAVAVFSGCVELGNTNENETTYVPHPISVSYTISYGFWINITGEGSYTILYDCDLPEDITEEFDYNVLYQEDYVTNSLVENNVVSWDIDGVTENSYKLGITSDVEISSFMVSDLKGEGALTIDQISQLKPELVDQYCNAQYWKGTTYVNPEDPDILDIISEVYDDLETDNSFIVAKELFRWLKSNTDYIPHYGDDAIVQPADVTCDFLTGDCDDLSLLYISLCRAVNIPARFIKGIIVEQDDDGKISLVPHAWVEVYTGGGLGNKGWIPVECAGSADEVKTEIYQNFALESVNHLRLFQGDGSNESFNVSMSGPSISSLGDIDVESEQFIEVVNYEIIESKKLNVDENNIRRYIS